MVDAALPEPWILNRNGAWCWYQDERAVIDPERGLLVVGSVAAPEGEDGEARAGNVEVTVADLKTGEAQVAVLHEKLQADDHNVPALWQRSDGRWLAMYTRHGADSLTRWRISEPGDPTRWAPEQVFDWRSVVDPVRVTYSNIVSLDGRLYCFARAINDDNCALVSDDEGSTWSFAGKLFDRPKVGYVNGYCRYDSAAPPNTDAARVEVITTDHHPRDFNNSIYHGYLAGGALHDSAGTVVDPAAATGGGVNQARLTTILAADSQWDGVRISHAWTTDVRHLDGQVAVTLTARADHPGLIEGVRDPQVDDLRFFYGRLIDGRWQMHQLAQAGPGLLPHEQDYTGLAAVDPNDLDSVYLSSPIDPRTGTATARREIYHGRTGDHGASWTWSAITEDSSADNLRPMVVAGDPQRSVVLWFRGTMTSSQNYNCEIAALVRPRG